MKLKIKNRNTKILKLLKTCFFITSILLLNCKCGFENKCENPLDPYTIIDVDKSGDTTDIIILEVIKMVFIQLKFCVTKRL